MAEVVVAVDASLVAVAELSVIHVVTEVVALVVVKITEYWKEVEAPAPAVPVVVVLVMAAVTAIVVVAVGVVVELVVVVIG